MYTYFLFILQEEGCVRHAEKKVHVATNSIYVMLLKHRKIFKKKKIESVITKMKFQQTSSRYFLFNYNSKKNYTFLIQTKCYTKYYKYLTFVYNWFSISK